MELVVLVDGYQDSDGRQASVTGLSTTVPRKGAPNGYCAGNNFAKNSLSSKMGLNSFSQLIRLCAKGVENGRRVGTTAERRSFRTSRLLVPDCFFLAFNCTWYALQV
jgi:hypothetical protein